MVTFGELIQDPGRLGEVDAKSVLLAALGMGEEVIEDGASKGDATMVFQHETIAMMRAERANKLEKLRSAISEASVVVPVKQQEGSLWDHITVGRASSADIVIDDPAVSSVHAHFAVDDDDENRMCVQDVGSSNGTFVNREPLQPGNQIRLTSGDCVRFGQSIFYFVNKSMLKELVEAKS